MAKKKNRRRTHWPQKHKIKKYKKMENPIEGLLEGGWGGRRGGAVPTANGTNKNKNYRGVNH